MAIGHIGHLAVAALAMQIVPDRSADVPTQVRPVEAPSSGTEQQRVVPAGTLVAIRIEAAISSRTARNDDMFPISLLTPVLLDGQVIIPAGTPGVGQVVHSAPRGFGGRAGELILAARYIQLGSRRIPLRGMRISANGRNNTAEAIALSAAVIGLFVTGTSADLEIGHEGVARMSEALVLEQSIESASVDGAVQPTGETE